MTILKLTPKPLHIFLFMSLNAIDMALTAKALSLGAIELNFIFATFGNPLAMSAVKMILTGTILLALVKFRRIYFIHGLNAGMSLVVIWNAVAVVSWFLPSVS